MRECILLHVSGKDVPGLTARLTAILAAHDVDILDMGQSVIHETLSLGLLLRLPTDATDPCAARVYKELVFAAHELDVALGFTPVPESQYEEWALVGGRSRHIVTLLARRISASHLAEVSAALAENDLNIDNIHRLTGRPPLSRLKDGEQNAGNTRELACIELSVRGEPKDLPALRQRFLDIAARHSVDIALQEDNGFRRNRKLVALDMDSTLVQAEGIDELARAAGVGEEVARVTEAAMRGELDFTESFTKRLSLLQGLPEAEVARVARDVPLTDGAERLIRNLKRYGYKVAVISGGFTYFGEVLKEKLPIDFLFANELEIEDGLVTGRVKGTVVDAEGKAERLRGLAASEGLSLQQTIAVGDGANDLPMLNLAGLGIAFHAKPRVKEGAGHAISTLGLDAILYLLGLRERDLS